MRYSIEVMIGPLFGTMSSTGSGFFQRVCGSSVLVSSWRSGKSSPTAAASRSAPPEKTSASPVPTWPAIWPHIQPPRAKPPKLQLW